MPNSNATECDLLSAAEDTPDTLTVALSVAATETCPAYSRTLTVSVYRVVAIRPFVRVTSCEAGASLRLASGALAPSALSGELSQSNPNGVVLRHNLTRWCLAVTPPDPPDPDVRLCSASADSGKRCDPPAGVIAYDFPATPCATVSLESGTASGSASLTWQFCATRYDRCAEKAEACARGGGAAARGAEGQAGPLEGGLVALRVVAPRPRSSGD